MTDEESKATLKMIEGHAARLREQGFETVQIFVSKFDDTNGTRFWETGRGNYCGRYGQVALWLEAEKVNTVKQDLED